MLFQIDNNLGPLLLDITRTAAREIRQESGSGSDEHAAIARLLHQIERELEPDAHRVVREITYEGSIAMLREQLGRSMPPGTRRQNAGITIAIRDVSDSRPEDLR